MAIGPLHAVSRAGEAALLMGTVQQPQGPVLQVGCLLHQLGVHHQVWGVWKGSAVIEKVIPTLPSTPYSPTGEGRTSPSSTPWAPATHGQCR